MTENQLDNAIQSYQEGLKLQRTDDLLLPCLAAMEQAGRKKDMLALVRGIGDLEHRDPHLRWRAAQVFCEHQCLKEARKSLQNIVDDDHVAPQLRQRANEVLDQLDDIERQQFRQQAKRRKKKSDQQ
jgi:exonuclease VII small subunit